MDTAVMLLQNESAVVAQAQVDPAAFAQLYNHYFSRVYSYVRYRINDLAAADDLVSTIFERALTHIADYDARKAPFGAWLFAIARHAVTDKLRGQQRRTVISLDGWRERLSQSTTPEQAVANEEERHRLLQAVAGLSERERDLIALKFAGSLTNRRIAEMTGLSESNVGVILYRSMQKLRTILEAEVQGHE